MLRWHSSEHLETYALLSKANINGPAQGSLPFTNRPVQGSLRSFPALSPGGRLTNASLRVDLPFDKLRANGFDRLRANETGNSPFVPSAAQSLLRKAFTCPEQFDKFSTGLPEGRSTIWLL